MEIAQAYNGSVTLARGVEIASSLGKKKKYLWSGTYLNLLVKPRIFFRFSGKNIILCILKGKMPFKMHKIIFLSL